MALLTTGEGSEGSWSGVVGAIKDIEK